MRRREVIARGLGALACVFVGPCQSEDPLPSVRTVLRPSEATRDAGRRCLAAFGPGVSRADLARAAGILAVRREEDLLESRVVLVDGWVLARSEAALLALVALA
jgi:hypothetical protein